VEAGPSRLPLLGRDDHLTLLEELLGELPRRGGGVVLVRGEAGIGKSTLLEEFVDRCTGVASHVGGSDELLVPQPFGPLWDVARSVPGVHRALRSGDRRAVLQATFDLVSAPDRSCVLVLEDTQWADEATLDLILYLGRRVARTRSLLVLTYRDGEVDDNHPLRRVLGQLPHDRVTRLSLRGLDLEAVRTMLDGSGLDAAAVHALTGGNPLFVREVLASGTTTSVPSSVRDAVIARGARLSPDARRVVDLVSVSPGSTELAVVESVLGEVAAAVQEASCRGLLRVTADVVAFHHELTRRAWESALDSRTRRRLPRELLRWAGDHVDPARAAHWARAADDVEAIVRLAPVAARVATDLSSHREAVQHLRGLAPHLDRLPPGEQAELAHQWARSEFYTEGPDYLAVVEESVRRARAAGEPVMLARSLVFAVRAFEVSGRPVEATAADEAVSLLDVDPPREGLAAALAARAWLHMMQGSMAEAMQQADRAVSLADALDDRYAKVHALNTWGSSAALVEAEGGVAALEESRRLAAEAGLGFEEARALINLTNAHIESQRLESGAEVARSAVSVASRHQVLALESYGGAQLAEAELWSGSWEVVEAAARDALDSHPHADLYASWVLGTLLTRRGDPRATEFVDRCWLLSAHNSEPQNVLPAAAAVAEHLWTTGQRRNDLIEELGAALAAAGSVLPWRRAWLTYWLWRLEAVPPAAGALPPYGAMMTGRCAEAASWFAERRRPFEQALALSQGTRAERCRALGLLEEVGACATADRVRAVSRGEGMTLPRGRDRRTRANAAGLTPRQEEVLQLLAEGCTNARIADELFLSLRTVENHVASILARLGAVDRAEAVGIARDRGLLGEPGHF
jgi:DNA-binding CsgD family transcriptional regulator/tetratricopeptide (TPR) repeat protein